VSEPDAPAPEAAADRPLRVLLVEDNETNRRLIASMLLGLDADLTAAENGLEGVEAFARESFDVVLMDLQMPVMDGYTATRKIRELESERRLRPTPVVVVSAHSRAKDIRDCLAAGADVHVAKPVDLARLLGTMTRAINAAAEADFAALTGEQHR
jgi:two-component system, sensor histidine kinase